MRARLKKLDIVPLSQSNPHATGGKQGAEWCGRTASSMLHNYYKSVELGDHSGDIRNDYVGPKFNLVYPNGSFAATKGQDQPFTFNTREPLNRTDPAPGAWRDEQIYTIADRQANPVKGENDREGIDRVFAPVLDVLDVNNPLLFGTGVSKGRGSVISHFIIISGYRYEDGSLWLQITDPALEWSLFESILAERKLDPRRYLDIENKGSWPKTFEACAKASGARYWVRAWLFLSPNPWAQGHPKWAGNEPPGGALLVDNTYSVNDAERKVRGGGGARITYRTKPTRDSKFSITDYSISWPINPAATSTGGVDWTSWTDPGAPFPIGRSMTWHGGVHLLKPAARDERVFAFAPGELVLARFARPLVDEVRASGRASDASFVLVRHRYDVTNRSALARPAADAAQAIRSAFDRAPVFYSLYMHLDGLGAHVDADGFALPAAAPWVRQLLPEPLPARRTFVAEETPITMLTWADAAQQTTVVLPMLAARGVSGEPMQVDAPTGAPTIAGVRSIELAAGTAAFWVLPEPGPSAAQAAAWTPALEGARTTASAPLHFYNPLTSQVFTGGTFEVPAGVAFTLTDERGEDGAVRPAIVPVLRDRDGCYCAVQAYARPGFTLDAGYDLRENLIAFHDGASVRLVSTKDTVARPPHALAAPEVTLRFLCGELPKCGKQATRIDPTLDACVRLTQPEYEQILSGMNPPKVHGRPGASRSPTLPVTRALLWHNPLTSEVIDSGVQLPAGTPLRGERHRLHVVAQEPDGYFVAVPGWTPTLDLAGVGEAQWSLNPDDTILWDSDVTAVTLYADTRGTQKARFFERSAAITLQASAVRLMFRLREPVATTGPKPTTGEKPVHKTRAWPDLSACVRLTEAQLRDLNAALQTPEQARLRAVQRRLAAGLSRLYGVEFSEASGWTYHHTTQTVQGAAAPTGVEGRLHLSDVTIQGAVIDLEPVTTVTSEPPNAVHREHALEFAPVQLLYRKADDRAIAQPRAALIEVFAAVPKAPASNNDGVIKAVRAENDRRRPLLERFRQGGVVDLSDKNLDLSREVVGTMGVVARPDARALTEGFHFEVFAGTNLAGPVDGADNAITPVPGSNWLVLRDDDAADQYTAGFVERIYALLSEQDSLGLDRSAIDAEGQQSRVLTPTEWLEFTGANALAISQLIAVHTSEWRTDFRKVLEHPGARRAPLSPDRQQSQRDDVDRLAWWADGLALQGADRARPLFHFHPLRLIEWMTTGLDIDTRNVAEPGITVHLGTRRERTFALTADPRSPGAKGAPPPDRSFHFRTAVGEGAARVHATLELVGFETATTLLPVQVQRGSLRRIQLQRPRVGATRVEHGPTVVDLPVPVKVTADPRHLFLLADGNTRLPDVGVSRVTIFVEVIYNYRSPTRLKLGLTNPQAYAIVDVRPPGERFVASGGPNGEVHVVIGPDPAQASPFEQSTGFVVEVDVAAGNECGEETMLTATVEGGDFVAGARGASTKSASIATRVLRAGKHTTPGADLAKLGLYLSQIPAADGLPCYRSTGSVSATVGGGPSSSSKERKLVVDGSYSEHLARAIWRFAYTYVHDRSNRLGVDSVAYTDANGKAPAEGSPVALADLRTPPAPAVAAARQGRNCAHYPVVDHALVEAIALRFAMPYVAPAVHFEVEDAPLPAAEPTRVPKPFTFGRAEWNKTDLGKTAILPHEADAVHIWITSPDLELVGRRLELAVQLSPGSAYCFPGRASHLDVVLTAPLEQRRRITLLYSGTASAEPARNLLVVSLRGGGELASLQLAGARALERKAAGASRDAAILQFYLSQLEDESTRAVDSLLKKKVKDATLVDGVWDDASLKALALFKKQHGEKHGAASVQSFARVVAALVHCYENPVNQSMEPTQSRRDAP